MPAEVLQCPMCGAPAASDATRCEHCGARLATIACPSCFAMIFAGAKFCSHCGARVDRAEEGATSQQCPRCRTALSGIELGKTALLECPKCEGLWADQLSLEQICSDTERQAAVLGMPSQLPANANGGVEQVRYLPCPVCRKLMNRVNFARCSHVVVDVCSQHGTWFDRDELRRIVEFIRAGGLDRAREQELADLEAQRRALKAAQMGNAWETGDARSESASSLLRDLFGFK